MIIESDRRIAVFDLDGVLIQNPDSALGKNNVITSSDYWEKHWKSPDDRITNPEMVELALALIGADWQLIVLTARPEYYRPWTVRLLRRMDIMVQEHPRKRLHSGYGRPILHMLPGGDVPHSSAAWKQDTIKDWLDQGARIQFMVEDYPWNAEAVRAVVPVMLYEYKRQSHRLLGNFACCGGMTRCLCSVRTSNASTQADGQLQESGAR